MSQQAPSLGRIVLVTTPERLNGQLENAAIITQVWNDDMINVTVFPGSGAPFNIGSVFREGHADAKVRFWRWPPHVPPKSKKD